MELAVARRRPRDHWRRIRFVADAARAFVDGGGTSLRGFVTWLARQVDEEARAVEVVVPEPDDDAVRILTVHGAKGLEFPVVVLAGLGVADRNIAPMVLWDRDGCPQVQIGPRDRRDRRVPIPQRRLRGALEPRAGRGRRRADPPAVRRGHPRARPPRGEPAPPGRRRRRTRRGCSRRVESTADLWLRRARRRPARARRRRRRPGRSRPTPTTASRWAEQRARRDRGRPPSAGRRGHRARGARGGADR